MKLFWGVQGLIFESHCIRNPLGRALVCDVCAVYLVLVGAAHTARNWDLVLVSRNPGIFKCNYSSHGRGFEVCSVECPFRMGCLMLRLRDCG